MGTIEQKRDVESDKTVNEKEPEGSAVKNKPKPKNSGNTYARKGETKFEEKVTYTEEKDVANPGNIKGGAPVKIEFTILSFAKYHPIDVLAFSKSFYKNVEEESSENENFMRLGIALPLQILKSATNHERKGDFNIASRENLKVVWL